MKHTPMKFLPVTYPVFQAIAELNRCFEDATHILDRLAAFNLFHRRHLQTYRIMLEEVRALTNQEMAEVVNDRELHNSAYFERLRLTLENGDPKDSRSESRQSTLPTKKLLPTGSRRPVPRRQKAVRP